MKILGMIAVEEGGLSEVKEEMERDELKKD